MLNIIFFFPNGDQISPVHFKDLVPMLNIIFFFPNGDQISPVHFKDLVPMLNIIFFFPNGDQISQFAADCQSKNFKNTNWMTVQCTNSPETRHVFVKHGCPRRQQSQTMAKISKSYILTPPNPPGACEVSEVWQPLDELTVQVWLLYDHPNFKYCTLFISGTELRTDKRTNRQTDDPNTRCPRRTFQAGGIKRSEEG